jgi:hypothetical protein
MNCKWTSLFTGLIAPLCLAEGTIAGTDIDNTATVSYEVGGVRRQHQSDQTGCLNTRDI